MQRESSPVIERRTFLATAAAATGLSILPAATAFGSDANARIRLGLIGCGGRGGWIADLFAKDGQYELVAVADYFRDRADRVGEKHGIPPERRFTGLDGYKGLLDAGVDAVAIETPPCFHPEQAVAALAAGKHVYLAKPIAVDVPGCLAIVEAANARAGQCSVLVDFQTRNNPIYREAVQRVHGGIIGEPVIGQAYYYASRLGIQAEPGTEVARLRNWVFDKALSGDIIVEQNIHVIDVANWLLRSHPTQAHGTGGRKVRTDVGDCWDHFMVQYVYPNGAMIDFSSAQFTHGFDDLCVRLCGSLGAVETHYGGKVWIRGKREGWKGGDTGRIYEEGAVNNIRDFAHGIRNGALIDNALDGAHSTLAAILGRTAAYEGRTVTWDEMIARNEKLDPKLDLPAGGPELQR